MDDFSAKTHAFGQIHVGQPLQRFVSNLHSTVDVIQAGEAAFPVTIDDGARPNAWICSPRATYSDCAGEEAARYLPALLAGPCKGLSTAMGRYFAHCGLDRVVAINNWVLSTNLYPRVDRVHLTQLIDTARQRWPGHALWFRSLNETDNQDWLAALVEHGFQLVASRQVYLYEDFAATCRKNSNLKRDMALLVRTDLRRVGNDEIVDDDYARIARLYELLYMEKYSRLNPHYTAAFMRCWHRAGLLEFHGFRDASGQLVCIIGLFCQGQTITAPIVGYDTALPQKLGLYRLLTACAYEVTLDRGCRLNFSAGAADFKRMRGGKPAIEYSAVHAAHLPLRTRFAVGALSALTRRIGVPLMTRYKL